MKSYSYILLFFCLWIVSYLDAQSSYFPIDTLDANDIRLEQIDHWQGNTFVFKTTITTDSICLIMPSGLAKGYYEVYYDNDSNKLALTYYNYGRSRYTQQYYKDGSMKSDTEYNRYGLRYGLHVIYDRSGEEAWHANYYWGDLDDKYYVDYLDKANYTLEAMEAGAAWGTYEFRPTPSRARHDRIILQKDSTFSYQRYDITKASWGPIYQGTWWTQNNLLQLQLSSPAIWKYPQRDFIITGNRLRKKLELIEVKPWGLDWYYSEYKKRRKS
ncbi:MAG: hypothetical protein GY810_06225 [Aureispira sp.]|nr:hypothetical protein [Aureispira sp.]